jgi:hypothetical protein
LIDKEPLGIKEFERGGIEKGEQLMPRHKSSSESRTLPKAAAKPAQPVIEYDFSSIIVELKSKLIFFFREALRSLLL